MHPAPTDVPRPTAAVGGAHGGSGWHADPWRRHQVRFYDGTQWTEHVADGGLAGLDSTPVAGLPRSHPAPARSAPPDDPTGPRVIDEGPAPAIPATSPLDLPLLLFDLVADDDGARRLAQPDDTRVGAVVVRPAPFVTRLGRRLVSHPNDRATEVAVLDATGAEVLALARPSRRTEPTVDVRRAGSKLGRIEARSVVQGLWALVVAADGSQVGVLAEVAPGSPSLSVTGADGVVLARTTPVWDVPGARHHLPPGVVLVDRREPGAPTASAPPTGPPAHPDRAALLLGALLAPALLRPPA